MMYRNADGMEALLSELEDERTEMLEKLQEIEPMIAKLRQYLGRPEDDQRPLRGLSLPDASLAILKERGDTMTTKEVELALQQGGVDSKSKHFNQTVYSTLRRLHSSGKIIKDGTAWRHTPLLETAE